MIDNKFEFPLLTTLETDPSKMKHRSRLTRIYTFSRISHSLDLEKLDLEI